MHFLLRGMAAVLKFNTILPLFLFAVGECSENAVTILSCELHYCAEGLSFCTLKSLFIYFNFLDIYNEGRKEQTNKQNLKSSAVDLI